MAYQIGNTIMVMPGESLNIPFTLTDSDESQLVDLQWAEMRIGTDPVTAVDMEFDEGETETTATFAMESGETVVIEPGIYPLQIWVTFGTENTEVFWEGELNMGDGIIVDHSA